MLAVLASFLTLSAWLACPLVSDCQTTPQAAQEQDSRRASSSPLYPPQGVIVEFQGKVASISWEPILVDRIAKYEVYRWNGKGEVHWEKIGSTDKPKFLDKKGGKDARYKVVAVDRAGNKSDLSQSKMSVVLHSHTSSQH
jgi:fibronectin type 3 domain-containing protein